MFEISGRHDGFKILLPVSVTGVSPSGPRLQQATALLDTGATSSGLCSSIVTALELPPLGRRVIHTAGGSRRTSTYKFGLAFPQGPGETGGRPWFLPFELDGIEFTEGASFQVLIGMDVIGAGTLLIRPDRYWALSFA